MHWLEQWRREHQMSKKTLADQVGASEALIDILENQHKGITHPKIADAIADYTGATPQQRDSIVHKKHHGTYKPKKKPVKKVSAEKNRPEKMRNGPPKREILLLNEGGVIMRRCMGLEESAMAVSCTMTTVRNRCSRLMSPSVNEFLPYGVTFRYADEWEAMTEVEQIMDMRNARGCKKARGRQCGKEYKTNEHA